ncbi:IclR family transcriptional regulator [uncultured Jatrophihabitans sp.]|uniref:IclR family transcriptional regulator n=1 Tax=uncultured Jatrophihabitans sp. TaxID=1610747 RepID=UPI0035CA2184
MAGNATEPGRTVLSRAVAVLDAFDESHRSLTATEIAARATLPLSTAHRLIGELVAVDVLARTGDRYVVGRRLWTLGLLAPVQTGLRDVAAPFLQDIYAATRATVQLAVRDGHHALYVDRIAGNSSVAVLNTPGGRLPLHTTGVGKVLLAHAPTEVRNEVLRSLTRVTAHSVTHVGRMRDQLRRVREQGYATTSEEMSLGASSIAVPVVRGPHGDGPVVAALGLVVPELGRHRPRLLSALLVAARGIGRSLVDP